MATKRLLITPTMSNVYKS